MAKFFGAVGYATPVEQRPGVWVDSIVERNHYGDIQQDNSSWRAGDSTNDDLNINNRISIMADQYAFENFHSIKYVEFMGAKWKVKTIEPKYPRLILYVGGVYNG